jgi:hypothetical protein
VQNQLRNRFLWYGGNNAKKKYALVVWKNICKDKKQRGLGVSDLDIMNRTLLAK